MKYRKEENAHRVLLLRRDEKDQRRIFEQNKHADFKRFVVAKRLFCRAVSTPVVLLSTSAKLARQTKSLDLVAAIPTKAVVT